MRVAAEFRRVRMCPGDRSGCIVHERGEPHLRIQPVIGDHDEYAARGQTGADEAIHGLRSGRPSAAVEEHQHRRRYGGRARGIDVEGAAWAVGVGDVAGQRDAVARRQCVQYRGRRAEVQQQHHDQRGGVGPQHATPCCRPGADYSLVARRSAVSNTHDAFRYGPACFQPCQVPRRQDQGWRARAAELASPTVKMR